MLKALVRFSIRFRGMVIALAVLLAAYGIYTMTIARLDVFPEFAPPLALVQTEAPGLSAEQVERLVTQPVENALGGALGVATMKSKSLAGLSFVTLTFTDDTDVRHARQLANERLSATASTLPAGVHAPELLPLTSSTSVVLVAGLTSSVLSAMDLHDFAAGTIKPRLLGLPGVADVIVFGGESRQLQVQIQPRRLAEQGLAIHDVVEAARRATGVRGAGFIEDANQRIVLHVEGQASDPRQLAATPLTTSNGRTIRLGDVATIAVAPAAAVGAVSIDGQPGLQLVIQSQYGADPTRVTASIDRAFASLAPVLASAHVDLVPDIFRPTRFIGTAIDHVRNALLLGGALVIAVLFLFLLDVRTAFISAIAIPLSLLAAVIVLHRLGISLSTMTLGGLAIALGEVVDDAVVDVENIFRRLRENRASERPLPAARVVLRASLEVRGAVVYATFAVALVFLPVLALSGVTGKLFAPLGIAYILAVMASLAVALTLTPALGYALLAKGRLPETEPRMVRALKARYVRWLERVEGHVRWIVVGIAVLCALALTALPFLETTFIPELKEGHYTVHMALAPGTSLQESMRIGGRVSEALLQVRGVRLVSQRAGRAGDVVDPVGVNVSEIEVDLKSMSGADQSRALVAIRQTLDGFAGLTTSVNTFLTERIDETISGYAAPVIVSVFGDDLDLIEGKAAEIQRLLSAMPGAIGVNMPSAPRTPELVVRMRPAELARYGIAPLDALEALQTAFDGTTVTQVYEGNRVHDVVVVLDPASRRSVADVGALPIRGAWGPVALDRIAYIGQAAGRSQIDHDRGQRVQTVTTGVRGRSVDDFVREARARIANEIRMPRGTYVAFAGEAQARSRSQHDLVVNAALAAIAIVLLLFLALRTTRAALLVLVNLPFALVGGVAAVIVTGGGLSLGSMIGFVTLFGITLRNSIMLISHYQHLVERESMAWSPATSVRGASERLVPILMTATVTALGLLPLALGSGEPGSEIEGPMATVILGGLVTSTALNLLVLPTLALRFGRFERRTDEDSPDATRSAPTAHEA